MTRKTITREEPAERIVRPRQLIVAEPSSTIWMRKVAIIFLFSAYGGALAFTFVIYFLQGFKWHGFNLDYRLLRWLGIATIGEIGGLAAMVYGALFRRQ